LRGGFETIAAAALDDRFDELFRGDLLDLERILRPPLQVSF
jgi:hypothetical protein